MAGEIRSAMQVKVAEANRRVGNKPSKKSDGTVYGWQVWTLPHILREHREAGGGRIVERTQRWSFWVSVDADPWAVVQHHEIRRRGPGENLDHFTAQRVDWSDRLVSGGDHEWGAPKFERLNERGEGKDSWPPRGDQISDPGSHALGVIEQVNIRATPIPGTGPHPPARSQRKSSSGPIITPGNCLIAALVAIVAFFVFVIVASIIVVLVAGIQEGL